MNTLFGTTNTGYVVIDNKGNIVDPNDKYPRITSQPTLGETLRRSVIEWGYNILEEATDEW